jgi:AcrR family transcriptional regulator
VARPYRQRARAEAAEETRQRVLDATRDRLRAAPTEPLSLELVAASAGVARSTIYLTFGSRAGLFEALVNDLIERGGMARLADAVADPDVHQHLRRGVRAGLELFANERDLCRVLFSMSQLDPAAVGNAVERWENERKGGISYLARRLDEHGVLAPHLTVEDAISWLWVLTGFESFDALVTGRGLTTTHAVEFLADQAERSLLRDSRPT